MLNKYIEVTYTRYDGTVDCEEIAKEYLFRKKECKHLKLQDVIEDYLYDENYNDVSEIDMEYIKTKVLEWIEEIEKEDE